jgi:phosphosulfolactate synthase
MNYSLSNIPDRTTKPRQTGINMVMDKGLSINEAKNLVAAAGHLVDFVKLGFGTSAITNNVEEKIAFYQDSNIDVYLGGTLFEAFLIRNQYEDYKKLLKRWELNAVEVSDGSMSIPHDEKCKYIKDLKDDYIVLSEVGKKSSDKEMSNQEWVESIQKEMEAGSFKVIAEARESGTVGIYDKNGKANTELISMIKDNVSLENMLWEAPIKSQQAWFVEEFGANVNIGNISPNEVIALETLRIGLRGDTFFKFL